MCVRVRKGPARSSAFTKQHKQQVTPHQRLSCVDGAVCLSACSAQQVCCLSPSQRFRLAATPSPRAGRRASTRQWESSECVTHRACFGCQLGLTAEGRLLLQDSRTSQGATHEVAHCIGMIQQALRFQNAAIFHPPTQRAAATQHLCTTACSLGQPTASEAPTVTQRLQTLCQPAR